MTNEPFRGLWTRRIEIAANISLVLIGAVVVWHFSSPWLREYRTRPRIPKEPLSLAGAHPLGNQSAPVGMIAFSDFQCPFCRRFAQEILPVLNTEYIRPGKLLVAFRHFPIESIHPLALKAAITAQCAEEQHLFWPMHDYLFAHPDALNPDVSKLRDNGLLLDGKAFETCRSADVSQIHEDVSISKALKVSATPTFFVGAVVTRNREPVVSISDVISGAKPISVFRDVIDRLVPTLDSPGTRK